MRMNMKRMEKSTVLCCSCVVEGRPLARAAISRNKVVPSNKVRAHTERGKRHTEIVKKSFSSAGSVAQP